MRVRVAAGDSEGEAVEDRADSHVGRDGFADRDPVLIHRHIVGGGSVAAWLMVPADPHRGVHRGAGGREGREPVVVESCCHVRPRVGQLEGCPRHPVGCCVRCEVGGEVRDLVGLVVAAVDPEVHAGRCLERGDGRLGQVEGAAVVELAGAEVAGEAGCGWRRRVEVRAAARHIVGAVRVPVADVDESGHGVWSQMSTPLSIPADESVRLDTMLGGGDAPCQRIGMSVRVVGTPGHTPAALMRVRVTPAGSVG